MLTGNEKTSYVSFKCSVNCKNNNQIDYQVRASDLQGRKLNRVCPLCGNVQTAVITTGKRVIRK